MLLIVKKTKYVLFLIIVCLFPNVVHADCSYERMAELSRIASNVQFSYDYEIEKNIDTRAVFYVDVSNITSDIYIEDEYKNKVFNSGRINQKYFSEQTAVYHIYSNDASCKNELLLTKYLSFPIFNPYSQKEACQKNPSFKLCAVWMDTSMYHQEDFNAELEKYTNLQTIKSDKEKQKSLTSLLDNHKNEILLVLIACVLLLVLTLIGRKIIRRS